MLSISPPMKGAGKGNYYTGLAQEDYYTKGGEPLGEWYGEGAEQLGLNGKVKDIELRLALEGFSPTGEKLVQNAGDKDRQSGWDLTFSAPKSVSILAKSILGMSIECIILCFLSKCCLCSLLTLPSLA